MKITMLGFTGAGKTCYMLGMYSFMSIGLRGFTLSAKDADEDIELSDKWDNLVFGQGDDRWPPATNRGENTTYAFDFNYGFRQIMSFEWLDYRGGALRDKSTEEDVTALVKHTQESSCLFLCISGEHLQEAIVDTQGQVNSSVKHKIAKELRIDRMNKLIKEIQQKIKPNDQKPYPIVIVVTKYDLCMDREKGAIVEDIKQLFEPLFQPNSGWLVTICPVSLGKELAENPENGAIKPINVHIPVVFAIYAKLREIALQTMKQQSSVKDALTADQNSFWTRLLNSEKIGTGITKVGQLQEEVQKLKSNMALLAQELQKVPLFLSGKEVEADV
ncbi:MAG: hypothetical protein HC836_44160 [Richelia sp. RM2_1_2]|nr:hypothetical protein [Richelia sp. RM1_1_1]NJO64875.1 hypothetical protein [Richelia sp. RM2_1_2]